MIGFLILLLHVLVAPFKTRARLEAEVRAAAASVECSCVSARPSRPKLTVADRLLFVWLYRLFPSVLSAVAIVQPETVIRWHRDRVPAVLALEVAPLSGRCGPKDTRGDPPPDPGNEPGQPAVGCASHPGRTAQARHREVAGPTVARYMAKSGRGRSQSWKTFLHNHASGIGAMDFLIVPTVGFRLLFVLVILRHERRRLISLSVTAHPTAEWIARQITVAFPWDECARLHTSRPRRRPTAWRSRVRLAAMGIRDHPTAPRSPWQNGHAERLIGSIRRECLDHVVVFGEAHLRRDPCRLRFGYYNELRTHLSLAQNRQAIGRSNGSASSLPSQFSADFIFNTAGSSSR